MRTKVVLAVIVAVIVSGLGVYAWVHRPRIGEYPNTWGYIDKTGKWVIRPQFHEAGEFCDGLAKVSRADKPDLHPRSWIDAGYPIVFDGFVDRTGKTILQTDREKANYLTCTRFCEGLAPARKDGDPEGRRLVGFTNKDGTFIINPQFNNAADFREGLALVQIGEKWGFINKYGRVVIEPRYDDAYSFVEGMAAVKFGEKWGFINKADEIIVQPRFDKVRDFSDGMAAVEVGKDKWTVAVQTFMGPGFKHTTRGKWGYIDRTGKLVVPPQFGYPGRFSEGLVEACTGGDKNGKYGFLDKAGKWAIKPQYDWADSFSEGLAAVRIDGKDDFIDKTGRVVATLPPRVIAPSPFHEGLAKVQSKATYPRTVTQIALDGKRRRVTERYSRYGYVDRRGRLVIECTFYDANDFTEGLAAVQIDTIHNP